MKGSVLYKTIKQQIKSKLSEVVYIDLQKGQFDHAGENFPIPLPCILFEFGNIDYSQVLKNSQIGDMRLSICYYTDLVTETFDEAELEEESLLILDKSEEIFEAIQGLKIDGFSSPVRIGEGKPEYFGQYIKLRTDFSLASYNPKSSETVNTQSPRTVKLDIKR